MSGDAMEYYARNPDKWAARCKRREQKAARQAKNPRSIAAKKAMKTRAKNARAARAAAKQPKPRKRPSLFNLWGLL